MISTAVYAAYIVSPPLIGAVAAMTSLRLGIAVLVAAALMVVLSSGAMRATRRDTDGA